MKLQSQKGTAVEEEPPQLLFRAWKGVQFMEPTLCCRPGTVSGVFTSLCGCSWPISQMRKLSPREVQHLSEGHTAHIAEPV